MKLFKLSTCLLLSSLLSFSSSAQSPEISLGPQLSALGIGGSVSFGLTDYVSLSAELGFFKLSDVPVDTDIEVNGDFQDTVELDGSLDISGGIVAVHIHPFKSSFAIGVGLMKAKYTADVESEDLTGTVTLDDQPFPGSGVQTIIGEVGVEGTWPAIMIGSRGKGFNWSLGAAFAEMPEVDIRATGPLANDPALRSALDEEIAWIEDDLDTYIAVVPIVRLGYQFGIGSN